MRKQTSLQVFIFLAVVSLAIASTLQDQTSSGESVKKQPKNDWFTSIFGKVGNFGPEFQCYVCTLIVTGAEKYAYANELDLDDFLMNHFCKLFPSEVRGTCNVLISQYGPGIIKALTSSTSPDQVCRDIKICQNPQCNLVPAENIPPLKFSSEWQKYADMSPPEGGISAMDWIRDILARVGSAHSPLVDVDGDKSTADEAELRGYNWRGRDCNDFDGAIHPGRKADPYPGEHADYNCNGIKGKDKDTGKDYKNLFCDNTQQLGVVVMGDSAGAHAEIPAAWMNGTAWSESVFASILNVVLDEVDLPHFSGYTGYADVGNTGPVRSIYKNLYERNKCNFRDYQNIAVNGAASIDSLGNILALSRDQQNDHPLLMFLELVGNDVCWAQNNFDAYTTPDVFRAKIIEILDHLDTVVPIGSHLVILGLVNGSLIFEGVTGKTHPIGVTYDQYYDWSNCIQAAFCWGWLNTNATVRDTTTEWAMTLNNVYKDILTTYTAKNFDVAYYDFPAQEIWDNWIAEGNDPYGLIEPADGFHPNQIFHALLADNIWNALSRDHPDWLGEENPNNDQITQLFGDQGGY